MKFLAPLGRLLYGLPFILASFGHFTAGHIQYAKAMGVPQPEILVPLSGVLALLGGLSIVLGYKARLGAWLIVLFLVPVTLMMHKFWGGVPNAEMQMIHFMKNVTMLGGAVLIAFFGAGPVSIDHHHHKRK